MLLLSQSLQHIIDLVSLPSPMLLGASCTEKGNQVCKHLVAAAAHLKVMSSLVLRSNNARMRQEKKNNTYLAINGSSAITQQLMYLHLFCLKFSFAIDKNANFFLDFFF